MNKTRKSAQRVPRTASFVVAVQKEIERLIGSGELQGGSRINESAMAQKLSVSRGPIREACRTLEQQGLLRSELNRGFFVREIGVKEALDIYEIRASLFATAGRLAARVIGVRQLAVLSDLADKMDRAIADEDITLFYPLNNEFHRRVVEFSDNSKLMEIWLPLEAQLYLHRRRGYMLPGSMRSSNDDHRAMIEALGRGDGPAAATLMERHIMAGRSRMLQSLGAEPIGLATGGAA